MAAENKKVGLPYRPFLYTLDQIACLVDVSETELKQRHLYFVGRSTGLQSPNLMMARNMAHPSDTPDYRVAEREFIRWMKRKGFRIHEPTRLVS